MSEFEDELVDFDPGEFDEEEEKNDVKEKKIEQKKHVALTSSAFTDFLLKPELLRAVVDCGFEHPSQGFVPFFRITHWYLVQHECIPQAMLGNDLICQAQSGMGKTAVFVLTVLQQIDIHSKDLQCVVICHTRELAYQICSEFQRFTKYLPDVKTAVFFGGIHISVNQQLLRNEKPNVVVGTPGRVKQLIVEKILDVSKVRHFVIDEADKVLADGSRGMKKDLDIIFKRCPKDKQVMMFSATFDEKHRNVCRKYMKDPHEILVDDETKLTLHGIQQYFVELNEREKNQKLVDLLDALEFNQVVIFVRTQMRAKELNDILTRCKFPSIFIHGKMEQQDRIKRYKEFKSFKSRILVSTDLVGRGIDIQRVNIVVNYDMPECSDTYLHRVGRAGRFGTKGLAISFVSKDQKALPPLRDTTIKRMTDQEVLKDVQKRFMKEGKILPLPDEIDQNSYMNS